MSIVRQLAHKIIYDVLKKNVFSTKLLQQAKTRLRQQHEDTNLLYTLVKGTIKLKMHLDYIAQQYTDEAKFAKTDLKIKILLYLGLYQLLYCDSIPEHAAINETVELAKILYGDNVSSFVNAILRAWQRNPAINYPSDTIKRLSCQYSFEEDMIRSLIEIYGEEDVEYACLYFNDIPRLKVRVNSMATDPVKFMAYFKRRDIIFERCETSGNFLATESGESALLDVSFQEGYFSIQDPAAGLVVELIEPMLDMSIIDMFAAPGSKACYMAEIMQGTGEVIAIDKIPGKCKLIKQNLERLKLHNITVIAEDAFKYGPVAPAYDKVLLDVPCSGWGVMQKKAELRWQKNQDIAQLLKIQEQALKRGAKFVCPGGDLIYSTCTFNPKENEVQVNNFLNKNPEFELVDAAGIISSAYTENGFLKTVPWKHNIDGAFAARMRRKT
ncbi:MAG: 16S rRNA (cytosine(967)-C(5))-methyltransferase RsmB [Candidatus Cloacimonetes bacterium]|nr:16S rRNA (cytosine(967)-C(5))-methyltransferase RsmB [Candidatus Cloacimonadota bacterium]